MASVKSSMYSGVSRHSSEMMLKLAKIEANEWIKLAEIKACDK